MIKKLQKTLSLQVWKNTYTVIKGSKIIAYWWRGHANKNWGDKINPLLMHWLAGKEVVHVDDVINFRFLNVYTYIGSVVEHLQYNGVHIWGPGIISETSPLKIRPREIHAVRGPSTRRRLMAEGFDCPEVYGDPALLLPKFYTPEVEKIIELGIIPHFVDKDNKTTGKRWSNDYRYLWGRNRVYR